MNDQKKLKLSKETLRCLDDDALTDVVGGGGGGKAARRGRVLRQLLQQHRGLLQPFNRLRQRSGPVQRQR